MIVALLVVPVVVPWANAESLFLALERRWRCVGHQACKPVEKQGFVILVRKGERPEKATQYLAVHAYVSTVLVGAGSESDDVGSSM